MRFLIKIIFIVLFASAQAFAGNMEAKDKNALSSQASNQLVREATNLNENKVPFMLAAKEESYFYVFSQNGETELKSGILKEGETYILPHDKAIRVAYEGNIIAVVDGNRYGLYEIGLSLHGKEPHTQILLNYKDIKESIASQRIRLFAKEDSYVYVFRKSDNAELKVGPLHKGRSYVLPSNAEINLAYKGNIVVIIDGQYELPIPKDNDGRSTLSYEELKQKIPPLKGE